MYQKTLIHIIYISIMTKVNVSATVEMSATVGECLQQWGKCPRQCGEMSPTVGGNVCNSGEIEYDLRNLRREIQHAAIHTFA